MAEKKIEKADELLDHNYDGIEEYDNALPSWWLAIFYISIAFGIGYTAYYHFGPGLDQATELAQEMAYYRAKQTEELKTPVAVVDLEQMVKSETLIAKGKELFSGKCAACHGLEGQGMIGPNLTDNYWIHGGAVKDIKLIIEKGVPEKGMIPWAGVMAQEEIDAVLSYIWSLHGSNPSNPKQPEGELVIRSSN